MTATARENSASSVSQQTPDLMETMERDRLALTIMMAAAALIGIWSLACLLAGLFNIGGIMELGANWLSAVTGR